MRLLDVLWAILAAVLVLPTPAPARAAGAEAEGAVWVAQTLGAGRSTNRSRSSTTRRSSSSTARSGSAARATADDGGVRSSSRDVRTERSTRDLDLGDEDDAETTSESELAEEGSGEEGEAEDEEPTPAQRTLGKACMYGADGRVLYAPPGARCAAEDAAPARVAPAAGSRAPERRAYGRCLFGADGKLLHAPPGVTCR